MRAVLPRERWVPRPEGADRIERQLAQNAAAENGIPWSGQLFALPIGGFEYDDRIYVVIDAQAADHGHVLAWKRGLPPCWTGAMHEDSV